MWSLRQSPVRSDQDLTTSRPTALSPPSGVVHPEPIDGMIVNTALNSPMGYVSLAVWT